MDKTKRLICEVILLSIDELKDNLQKTIDRADIETNANAIKQLAEAYEKIKRS